MASASSDSVPVDDIKYLLTCSLCSETLNEPRSLPCLHNFCKVCLGKYIYLFQRICLVVCLLLYFCAKLTTYVLFMKTIMYDTSWVVHISDHSRPWLVTTQYGIFYFYAANSQANVLSVGQELTNSKIYVMFKAHLGAQTIKHYIVDIIKHKLIVLWLALNRAKQDNFVRQVTTLAALVILCAGKHSCALNMVTLVLFKIWELWNNISCIVSLVRPFWSPDTGIHCCWR